MKTIDVVIDIRKSLSELYFITNDHYVSLSDTELKPLRAKILKHVEELKSVGIVDEIDGRIKWITNAPTIETAYDYYCAISKKAKTFSDIKDIIENPENYNSSELMEAIAFNGFYEKETGKSFIEKTEEIISETIEPSPQYEETLTLNSPEHKELQLKFNSLKKEHQELQINYRLLEEQKNLLEKSVAKPAVSPDVATLIEYNKVAVDFLKLIADDTKKLDGIQGSFRKVIGQLTSSQINNIGVGKMLHAILSYLQSDLNGTNLHESVSNRRQILEDAIQISNGLNNYNDNNSRYLPNNGKNNS